MNFNNGLKPPADHSVLNNCRLEFFSELSSLLPKLFPRVLSLRFYYFKRQISPVAGEVVGVILLSEQTSAMIMEPMLHVKLSPRASRWLNELPSANTTYAEVVLVRRTLAWITGIILLLSALIGVSRPRPTSPPGPLLSQIILKRVNHPWKRYSVVIILVWVCFP